MFKLVFVALLVMTVLGGCDCQVKCSPELDMDFRGVQWSNDLAYEYAENFQACCARCDTVEQCNAWTFIFKTKVCVLKSCIGYKVPTDGRISGSRSAPQGNPVGNRLDTVAD